MRGNRLKLAGAGAVTSLRAQLQCSVMEPTMKREQNKVKLPKGADPDQAYHWTPEWKKGEREVNAELRKGQFVVYDSIDDMFDDMDRKAS